jgi:hypothetical protein
MDAFNEFRNSNQSPDPIKIERSFNELKRLNPEINSLQKLAETFHIPRFNDEKYISDIQMNIINITILTSASLEHVINLYIFNKLSTKINSEIFEDLEKIGLLNKWVIVPRLFNKEYVLKKDECLFQNLKELICRRNNIIHFKPNKKGKTIFGFKDLDDIKKYIDNCVKLLKDLLENLRIYDKEHFLHYPLDIIYYDEIFGIQ